MGTAVVSASIPVFYCKSVLFLVQGQHLFLGNFMASLQVE
jgi:hypothetical protein